MTGKTDRQIWKIFKSKPLEYGWLKRLHKSVYPETDFYQLTNKGDDFFRATQIHRLGWAQQSSDMIEHYRK